MSDALNSRLAFLLLILLVEIGCSKADSHIAPVRGRITLDGQPIKYADVTFQPEGKSPGVGRTDKDGRYMLSYKRGVMGTPIGTNRVTIIIDTQLTHGPQTVPARYNTATELQRDVKPGENVFDFELTTK
jgi:hypothetical protein